MLPDGSIPTYNPGQKNIDHIKTGSVVLALYAATGDNKYKLAADIVRGQIDIQSRVNAGGFWHKEIYPWQMWLDGLYMASPFYAEYSLLVNESAGFDDVALQITLVDEKTHDAVTGLHYHGWDESGNESWADPVTGTSPNFWGRAIGWYAMAIVDVLDYLPATHPERAAIIAILADMAVALEAYQHASGLWYQVVDQGSRTGNYLEASASSMYVYALAKGVNKGYIDASYLAVAQAGYDGLTSTLISFNVDSSINLNQICGTAGLGRGRSGSFAYYIGEAIVPNDLKGVGPFILAGIELTR